MSRKKSRIIAGMTAAGLFFLLTAAGYSAGFKYDQLIKRISDEYDMDANFVHAVIKAESAYNRFAISTAGAQGLMQLMPDTAKAYGVKDVFDAEENIRGGVKFLKMLLKLYDDNHRLALAAYNAGQEAVKKHGGKVPPYAETKTYIDRVLASYQAPAAGRKTRIYEVRNAEGRIVLTNDPRIAAQARGVVKPN
jgi:soluble lytic murein transglycosylase-like protein